MSPSAGINVLTGKDLTIQNNTFYNNGGTGRTNQAAIFVAGQAGGFGINDWETAQRYSLFTTGMVLTGNTVVNAVTGQFVFGTYLAGSDWTQFNSSLNAGNNTWYDPTSLIAFKASNGKKVDLKAWQSVVSSDYTSTWAPPAVSPVASCAVPTQSVADFSVNVDNRAYTMLSGNTVSTVYVNSFGYGAVALQVKGVPSG